MEKTLSLFTKTVHVRDNPTGKSWQLDLQTEASCSGIGINNLVGCFSLENQSAVIFSETLGCLEKSFRQI